MFPSGAASGVTARPRPALLVWLVALALAGAALAAPPPTQGTPLVMVDAFEYELGDTLTLRASGLEPGADYVVALTPPGGETVESTVRASRTGALASSAVLDEAGSWTVALRGPRVDARLGVRVSGPPDAGAAPGPGAGEGPGDEAPETEEGSVADQPGADQPGAEPEAEQPGADEPGAAGPGAAAPDAGAQPGEEPLPDEPAEEPPAGPPAEGELARPGDEPAAPGEEGEPGAGAPADGQLDALPEPRPLPPAQARGAIAVSLENGDVVGRRNGVEAWRLSFGTGSGETVGLIVGDESVLVGHGNHLLQVDRLTGTVQRRERLPAQVADLVREEGALVVAVRYASGHEARFSWPPERPLAFDPDPSLYSWLRAEAGVPDPEAQLARDPTNPWLYVAAARLRPENADALRRSALTQARTFYEYAQLAQEFMAGPARDEDLAAQAMNAALEDFAARGYRGSLLFEPDLVDAYGFPHAGLRQALEAGDRQAADFWAPWVYRLSGDGGPDARDLLTRYAQLLQDGGDVDAAGTWRELAADAAGTDPQTTLERAAAAVGSTGWYGVLALLVAAVALRLTLAAKYWRAQTLTLRQSREAGRTPGPLARALTLRYATFTEKLVLLLLFAAMVAVAALSGWADRAGDLPSELGSGSLASPTAVALLERAPDNPDRAFALAFAAQTSGDHDTAEALYALLGSDPDALNNLGVLRGDQGLYRRALAEDPRHPEAAFNAGEGSNPSRLMQAYRPDEPLLAAPDAARLSRAFAGSPWDALGAAFTNPFAALDELRPIETRWLWTAVVVLFLAWVAWTFLTVFVPRPQAARNAPRTFLYHVLALLLPGSGLADELWGVALLVPWAIFGIDTLRHLTAFGGPPALAYRTDLFALVVIYVVNTVAFFVELASYRRRMRDLRAEHPELAAAYGLRP